MDKHKMVGKNRVKNKTHKAMGGGLGQLVMVGGALAIAGLITTFAIKRNNKKNQRRHQPNQGLRHLLHTPASRCTNDGTSTIQFQEERVRSENESDKEIISLSDDDSFDLQDDKYGEGVEKEEEASLIAEDDNEEEENDNESSEETEESSMESNTEAIWPAELIEEKMPELEADQPERTGGETEKLTGFSNSNPEDQGTEKTMGRSGVGEIVLVKWLRFRVGILSMLIFLLLFILLLIFPWSTYVCGSFIV